MASGYLDLAYLIEISVVFNLAYREIKHGVILVKMKQIRERILKDKELQSIIEGIKNKGSLGGEVVKDSYDKLMAIIECDKAQIKDCQDAESNLCKAWGNNMLCCKHFVKVVLTGRGLNRVNTSIGIALVILVFATIFPHTSFEFNIYIWWFLFITLIITIYIPIHLIYMHEKVVDKLIGENGKDGRIEVLEKELKSYYNQYLLEQAQKISI